MVSYKEARKHSIVVTVDISISPLNIREDYKAIRDACSKSGQKIFLPLDYLESIPYEKIMQMTFEQIRNARLVVSYLGFNSTDQGAMIGETKLRSKPHIIIYEAKIAEALKRFEPKIWWAVKSLEERTKVKGVITPTSRTSFLIPGSIDPNIIKEIIFTDKEKALSDLEAFVRCFFK